VLHFYRAHFVCLWFVVSKVSSSKTQRNGINAFVNGNVAKPCMSQYSFLYSKGPRFCSFIPLDLAEKNSPSAIKISATIQKTPRTLAVITSTAKGKKLNNSLVRLYIPDLFHISRNRFQNIIVKPNVNDIAKTVEIVSLLTLFNLSSLHNN